MIAQIIVIFVQVGSGLWINPSQVIDLRAMTGSKLKTCIGTTHSDCVESDWTVDKIRQALERSQR